MLINELESEISSLTNQNNEFQKVVNGEYLKKTPSMLETISEKRDFLRPNSPNEYLKEENAFRPQKSKPKLANYVPSIKRIEKNKTPEFTIQLTKNNRY